MFDAFMQKYGTKIHRLARHLATMDLDLADDLEQEARIAIWQYSTKPVYTNEPAAIMRIARNAMYKYLRRERAAHAPLVTRRRPPARRAILVVTRQIGPPLRRFVPRHDDALPDRDARQA